MRLFLAQNKTPVPDRVEDRLCAGVVHFMIFLLLMRFSLPFIILVLLILPFAIQAAAPSAEFWNPFRDNSADISQEISGIIGKLLNSIGTFAGKAVSRLRIPVAEIKSTYKNAQPAYMGAASGGYNVSGFSLKSLTGIAPKPAAPITDIEEEGKPCGGGSGDPFWADDCSCHCSKGAVSDLKYESTGYCPNDSNRTCEDCRDITRHDNRYTKVSECKNDF